MSNVIHIILRFNGQIRVRAEGAQGADKHVSSKESTVLLQSKGAAAQIYASKHPEWKWI